MKARVDHREVAAILDRVRQRYPAGPARGECRAHEARPRRIGRRRHLRLDRRSHGRCLARVPGISFRRARAAQGDHCQHPRGHAPPWPSARRASPCRDRSRAGRRQNPQESAGHRKDARPRRPRADGLHRRPRPDDHRVRALRRGGGDHPLPPIRPRRSSTTRSGWFRPAMPWCSTYIRTPRASRWPTCG